MILILSSLLGVQKSHCLYFNLSPPNFTFSDSNCRGQILFLGSKVVNDAIQVTPDHIARVSGCAFYYRQFHLWKDEGVTASFHTTFVLNIKNLTSHGGEGLAFVLTSDTTVPASSDGQWLGIVNQETNGSPKARIVAIEFDTRKSYDEDLDDNHVGVDVNSVYSRKQVSLTSFGIDLSAGKDLKVVIRYDGESKSLSVEIDMINVLTHNIDLSAYLPQKVFVGFSASTSDETEQTRVNSWEL
ncbi:Concanavalin A-like lectin protein kinase family protein [Euphorbia peplus]|nr:Concanavalin A-like lectin protein kinase family protein [Euphorbia peplus]